MVRLYIAPGLQAVMGAGDAGAVAVGAPIRIGGRYTVPPVARVSGDTVDVLTDIHGRLSVEDYLIHRARQQDGINNYATVGKNTAASETLVSWTVTNEQTGFLSDILLSVASHASETLHIFYVRVNGTTIYSFTKGQGDISLPILIRIPERLVGDGVKVFDIRVQQSTTNASTYEGVLRGWEEPT